MEPGLLRLLVGRGRGAAARRLVHRAQRDGRAHPADAQALRPRRSQVLVADAGSEFAWAVGGDLVRWGSTFAPAEGGGARLTESWDFLPGGLGSFRERYGPDADAQIADRTSAALAGIPATLAAIKRAVEHQP